MGRRAAAVSFACLTPVLARHLGVCLCPPARHARFHPDKCGLGFATAAERDQIEVRFKLIQDAFEVLTDPAQRRMHDSTDVPEVALPTALEPGKDFYAAFRPGFDFLERFSERTPVPSLGDQDTPYADVDKFYTFWFAFKSWREFKHADEEDTSVADCREQKRELERKNAKLREKAKKEETHRIAAFVQVAYDADPRVQAHEAAAKAAKEAKKMERGAAKREQEAAEAAAKAEAAVKAEAEAKQAAEARDTAKKDKEAQRKALQKERKRLRTASEAAVASGRLAAGLADIETLCADLGTEALATLAGEVEKANAVDAQVELLTVAMSALQANYRERAAKAAASAAAPATGASPPGKGSAADDKPWAPAELKALEKAMKQFPVGTAKRWEVVADQIGSGRTADAVASFAKQHAARAASLAGNAFDAFLASRKGSAEVASEGGISTRDTAFTDVHVSGDADSWSEAQDLALVAAMKAHPKSGDDKARWAVIAAEVGNKSAAQCVKRVQALKAAVKKSDS